MGIDAGLVVVHQITDQAQWAQAMREIRSLFSGKTFMLESNFKVNRMPPRLDALLKSVWPKLATKPELIERIIALAYASDPLLPIKMEYLRLTEPVNFNGAGGVNMYRWSDFAIPSGHCIDSKNAMQHEVEELCDSFEHTTSSAFKELIAHDIDNAAKALLAADGVKVQDVFRRTAHIHSLLPGEDLQPPVLFSFLLGDKPSLPLFARHFKSFTSKVSGKDTDYVLDRVLTPVAQILCRTFPRHVKFYINDPPPPAQLLLPPLDAQETTDEFYEKLQQSLASTDKGLPDASLLTVKHAHAIPPRLRTGADLLNLPKADPIHSSMPRNYSGDSGFYSHSDCEA